MEKLVQILKLSFPNLSTVTVIPAGLPKEAFFERDTHKLPWLNCLLHEMLKQSDKLNLFDSLIQSHPYTTMEGLSESNIAAQHFYLAAGATASSETISSNTKIIIGVGVCTGSVAAVTEAGVGATIGALAIGIPTFGAAAGAGLVIGGAIGAGIGGAIGTVGTGTAALAAKN